MDQLRFVHNTTHTHHACDLVPNSQRQNFALASVFILIPYDHNQNDYHFDHQSFDNHYYEDYENQYFG